MLGNLTTSSGWRRAFAVMVILLNLQMIVLVSAVIKSTVIAESAVVAVTVIIRIAPGSGSWQFSENFATDDE